MPGPRALQVTLLVAAVLGSSSCTGAELDRLPAGEAPVEVIATGGRSFARIAPLVADAAEAPWTRITPSTGAWVARAWEATDVARPFTVVSPEGVCFGKVVAVLELSREIGVGVRDGRTAETSEVWDAAEIAGCPSFEGDRRIGLDGRVADAKWLPLEPGDAVPADLRQTDLRPVATLRTVRRDYRIVERRDGALEAVEVARAEVR